MREESWKIPTCDFGAGSGQGPLAERDASETLREKREPCTTRFCILVMNSSSCQSFVPPCNCNHNSKLGTCKRIS
jgi:hypothetical protein